MKTHIRSGDHLLLQVNVYFGQTLGQDEIVTGPWQFGGAGQEVVVHLTRRLSGRVCVHLKDRGWAWVNEVYLEPKSLFTEGT